MQMEENQLLIPGKQSYKKKRNMISPKQYLYGPETINSGYLKGGTARMEKNVVSGSTELTSHLQ